MHTYMYDEQQSKFRKEWISVDNSNIYVIERMIIIERNIMQHIIFI